MLDTRNIPKEELAEAMYQECLRGWNETYSSALKSFCYEYDYVEKCKNIIDDLASKQDYTQVAYVMSDLAHSSSRLHDSAMRLVHLTSLKPKKPE